MIKSDIPNCSLQELSNAASATAVMGCLDADTARMLDACFRRSLVLGQCSSTLDLGRDLQSDLKSVGTLLNAYRDSGLQPSTELLGHIRAWVIAAADADNAARRRGLGAGRGGLLEPPEAAAKLLILWADSCWAGKPHLPMQAVWALARSVADGAGLQDGFEGWAPSSVLSALGRLVSEGQGELGAGGAAGGTVKAPKGLLAGITRWARLAVARVSPSEPFALEDLGAAVWGVHALGVSPDAATAASAAEKLVAALSRKRRGEQLLAIAGQVSQPLVAWHRLGLVPDLAPVARALAARSAAMAFACKDVRALYELAGYMKLLHDAARLPMPDMLERDEEVGHER